MKKAGWKREIARDVLAFGSWVFFVIVLVRALIGPFYGFLYQLLIAGAVLLFAGAFVKKYDGYLARGVVLAIFTYLFYNDVVYGVFVIFVFMAMLASSYYVGRKDREVVYGVVIGLVSSGAGYYLSRMIV